MAGTATPLYSAPFDAVADAYDEQFSNSCIGRAQRQAVWAEMDRVFRPGQRVLEINCGTGVDALHLAGRGVEVDAFDSSPRMIQQASRKAATRARFEVLPIERLRSLSGSYDGMLSNFGGLNCVAGLAAVACDLARLLRPGGRALLCLCNRVCAWEIGWYLARGNARKAFRRMQGGRMAHIGEAQLPVWYPQVREMRHAFAPAFRLKSVKGIGVLVPPSYVEHVARRHPRLLGAAESADRVLSRMPLVRALADHILMEFERGEDRP